MKKHLINFIEALLLTAGGAALLTAIQIIPTSDLVPVAYIPVVVAILTAIYKAVFGKNPVSSQTPAASATPVATEEVSSK